MVTGLLNILDKMRELAGKIKILPAKAIDVIQSICIIVTFGVVIYDYYSASKKEHLDPTERFVISSSIRQDLSSLRDYCNAGKVFILGYHNGVSNFTRIPFVFADMRYEIVADTIEYTSEYFSNISLDKFSFAERHILDSSWHGHISSLNDTRLENTFKRYGVEYVYFGNIKNDKGIPVASVVICWYTHTNVMDVQKQSPAINSYIRNIKSQLLCHQ